MMLLATSARVSFANGLFVAEAFENGPAKFSGDFILEGDTKVFDISSGTRIPITMEAAMLAVAETTWPGNGKVMLDGLEPSKKSYRDGNTRRNKTGEIYAGYAGHKYIAAKSAQRPSLFDKDGKTPIVQADGKLYSGCYVNVSFEIYGMADSKKRGVFIKLFAVQLSSDGDSFDSSRVSTGAEFEDLAEGAVACDLV